MSGTVKIYLNTAESWLICISRTLLSNDSFLFTFLSGIVKILSPGRPVCPGQSQTMQSVPDRVRGLFSEKIKISVQVTFSALCDGSLPNEATSF